MSLEDKSDLEKDLIYEFRLLDAYLELEHSDECEMAIFESPKSIEEEGNDGEELTDGELKEASKVDGDRKHRVLHQSLLLVSYSRQTISCSKVGSLFDCTDYNGDKW